MATSIPTFLIGVGPVTVGLAGDCNPAGWLLDQAHPRFLRDPAGPATLTLTVRRAPVSVPDAGPTFRLGGMGGMARCGGDWTIWLGGDGESPPDRAVRIAEGGSAGVLTLDTVRSPDLGTVYPLQHPLEETLFRHLLAQRNALLLHACGIAWQGRGYLFVGSSGAGKSTTAGLWKAAGAAMLNDDRTVLEAAPDGIRIHPTPWFGEHPDVGGAASPLRAIYLLRKGAVVSFEPLRPAAAAALLFAKSFPPLWDAGRLGRTLGVLDRACRSVPCGWLTVPPDARAVEWVMAQG